ncbi:MAG TPA: hypothetical protein VGG46_03785 [Terriglobales bacterium]
MSSSGLARKLGIKPRMTVLLRDAPPDFASLLSHLTEGIRLSKTSDKKVDCVIAFVRCKADVEAVASAVLSAVMEDGLLWFAYPKKSSGMKSDLSRDIGWDPVFAADFDSVAQVSIDETWTGFRFRPKHLVGKRTR